jgi:hypothetical protein
MPAYTDQVDDNLLRTEPGLFPDPLMPMGDDRVAFYNSLNALWVDVEGECLPTGEYPITFRFRKVHGATGAYADEVPPVEATVLLRIINACLPKQTTKVTNWFHCDCLQTYYGTGAFDERHWNVIEEFAEFMGGREDIWYATNMEIYEYVQAYNRLETSYDKTFVYNPSNITVWFWHQGKDYCVEPGQTIAL